MVKNVGSNLHQIRNKIANATNGNDKKEDSIGQEKTVLMAENPLPKEFKKALNRRRDEFVKTKRDICSRLSESLAVIPLEIETCENKASSLKKAQDKYKDLLSKIEKLDDSTWNEMELSTKLTEAMRTLENSRLEFLRTSAVLSKKDGSGTLDSTVSGGGSLLHELNSLSFKQLFRLGFIFCLPLMISVVVAAVVISIVYYCTVRL